MKQFYFLLCATICSSLSGMKPGPNIQENAQHTWWLFGRKKQEKVVDPIPVQPIPANTRVENNWLPQLAPVPTWVVAELFPQLGDIVFDIEAEHNARHVICKVRNPLYQHAQQASREKIK